MDLDSTTDEELVAASDGTRYLYIPDVTRNSHTTLRALHQYLRIRRLEGQRRTMASALFSTEATLILDYVGDFMGQRHISLLMWEELRFRLLHISSDDPMMGIIDHIIAALRERPQRTLFIDQKHSGAAKSILSNAISDDNAIEFCTVSTDLLVLLWRLRRERRVERETHPSPRSSSTSPEVPYGRRRGKALSPIERHGTRRGG
jgi:hypothetical protein